MTDTPPQDDGLEAPTAPRRGFLAGVGTLAIGALAVLAPIGAGLAVLLDPLRRTSRDRGLLLVTRLSAVPDDGIPRKFKVTADRVDAWNTYRNVPVGAIYLRRTGTQDVAALNVVCPHAGCFVNLAPERDRFACPCHNSSFSLDGVINDPASPSPRDMDDLDVEIRNGDEVWVRFLNFRPGQREKTPVT